MTRATPPTAHVVRGVADRDAMTTTRRLTRAATLPLLITMLSVPTVAATATSDEAGVGGFLRSSTAGTVQAMPTGKTWSATTGIGDYKWR